MEGVSLLEILIWEGVSLLYGYTIKECGLRIYCIYAITIEINYGTINYFLIVCRSIFNVGNKTDFVLY